MKIVHVAESFSAGVLEFINYLTNNLGEFEHIIIYGEREIKERNANIEEIKKRFLPNVKFYKWKHAQKSINPYKDTLAFFNLYRLLKSLNCDVVHLHSSKAGFLGRIVSLFFKHKKVIYTPNGAYFLKTDISRFSKSMVIFLEKFAAKIAGDIVCCSKSERDAYLKHNISATYINNGITIPSNYFFKKPEETIRIVTSGRISYQKNPELFNDIAKLLQNEKNVRFIWVGEGELKELLNSTNIEITGWVTKEQVLVELNKSDLFISTSLWEGLPFSGMEAMSLAKPMLVHDCVGNIDLVEDNYNGFIFKTAEEAVSSIKKFLSNKNLINKFGSNSRKKCEKEFDINKNALLYSKIYLKS